uniref:SGNH hydrolase-type esterase domain-containing protein n=1 Tax=Nothobranchius furzeri TaxID=105023 RepID=A0A8C6K9T5_NOTFU
TRGSTVPSSDCIEPPREQLSDADGHPRPAQPWAGAPARRGVATLTPNPRREPSAQENRCSPGEPLNNIQQVPDGSSAPADPPPRTLIIGDSIIKHVRMSGAVTHSFPGAKVMDIAKRIPELIHNHPTVSKIIIHAGTNDTRMQQSELLKRDFIHLFNLLKSTHLCVFISGPIPTVDRGIGRFSRILSLNTWLSSVTVQHNIAFIDNFNIFWGRKHLFGPDGLHLNRQGTHTLKMSLACPRPPLPTTPPPAAPTPQPPPPTS